MKASIKGGKSSAKKKWNKAYLRYRDEELYGEDEQAKREAWMKKNAEDILPRSQKKGMLEEVVEQEVPEPHHQGIIHSPMEVQVEVKVDHQSHKGFRQKKTNGMKMSKN